MKARRYESVDRVVTILADLMSGKEHDRRSIAERTRVEPATADRHIKALVKCPGVKTRKVGNRTVLWFDEGDVAPSLPHAVAAALASSLANIFEDSNYHDLIRSALASVQQRTRQGAIFRNIERKFFFVSRGGEDAFPERSGLLDEAIDAVLKSFRARMVYQHLDGKLETVTVDPLSLAIHEHQLYLFARTSLRPVHPYRFARIQAFEPLETRFSYPTDYNPRSVLQHSFGIFVSDENEIQEVVVRLRGVWAAYATTHRWHRSQVRQQNPDRTMDVRLRVRLCPEVENWVLSMGEYAEVIAPALLRERLQARVEQLAVQYRTQPEQLDLFEL